MSIRDTVLPVIDTARSIIETIGFRRFSVIVRRRIWSGSYVGDGTPTNQDIVLNPTPRVRLISNPGSLPGLLEYLAANPMVMKKRLYRIDKITPAYSMNGSVGGYTPQQITMKIDPDLKNVEPVIVMVGDDGYLREFIQHSVAIDRAFGYTMIVEETDRPKVSLSQVVITPSSPTVVHGSNLQLVASGIFSDESSSNISNIVSWRSSDTTKATIDLLGNVTGVSAGTTTITAQIGLISAAAVTLTVT